MLKVQENEDNKLENESNASSEDVVNDEVTRDEVEKISVDDESSKNENNKSEYEQDSHENNLNEENEEEYGKSDNNKEVNVENSSYDESSKDENKDYEDTDGGNEDTGVKSKKVKRTIAAIVFAIFIFALVLFGYFVFFNKSVTGYWKIEDTTSDIVSVLILDKDGSAKFTNGSLTVVGKYKLNGDDKIDLNIETDGGNIFKGTYTYRVSAGLANRTLDLISSSNKVKKCTQYEFKEVVPKVNNFEPKKELLGKWTNDLSGYTYEFKDDGNVIMSRGNTALTLTYFVDDTSIKLMQYFIKENTDNDTAMEKLSYTLNGNNLIIGGLEFTKL